MRVSAIYDGVTRFHMGSEEFNEVINGWTSLDEKNDLARFLESRTQVLDLGALDFRACTIGYEMHEKRGAVRGFTFRFICQEIPNLAFSSIGGNDCEALVVHIQNEILTLAMRDLSVALTRHEWRQTMTARPMRPISALCGEDVSD